MTRRLWMLMWPAWRWLLSLPGRKNFFSSAGRFTRPSDHHLDMASQSLPFGMPRSPDSLSPGGPHGPF
jgi:hypothetical protein